MFTSHHSIWETRLAYSVSLYSPVSILACLYTHLSLYDNLTLYSPVSLNSPVYLYSPVSLYSAVQTNQSDIEKQKWYKKTFDQTSPLGNHSVKESLIMKCCDEPCAKGMHAPGSDLGIWLNRICLSNSRALHSSQRHHSDPLSGCQAIKDERVRYWVSFLADVLFCTITNLFCRSPLNGRS